MCREKKTLFLFLAEQKGVRAVVDLQIPFHTNRAVTRILQEHLGQNVIMLTQDRSCVKLLPFASWRKSSMGSQKTFV